MIALGPSTEDRTTHIGSASKTSEESENNSAKDSYSAALYCSSRLREEHAFRSSYRQQVRSAVWDTIACFTSATMRALVHPSFVNSKGSEYVGGDMSGQGQRRRCASLYEEELQ